MQDFTLHANWRVACCPPKSECGGWAGNRRTTESDRPPDAEDGARTRTRPTSVGRSGGAEWRLLYSAGPPEPICHSRLPSYQTCLQQWVASGTLKTLVILMRHYLGDEFYSSIPQL